MMATLASDVIRELRDQARDSRALAGEAVAKAAYAAYENNLAAFQSHMAEASRLAVLAGNFQREANEAAVANLATAA